MKYEKGSFVLVPNKGYLPGLEPHIQCVYMWLCHFSDDKGLCFPSRSTLATFSGCSVKSVDRALERLCDDGLIVKTIRKDGERNFSNLYQIMILEDGQVWGSDSQSLPGVPESLGVASESRTNSIHIELKNPVANAPDILEVLEVSDDTRAPKPKDEFQMHYEELCTWAAKRRGFKFASKVKQFGALKKARALGLTPAKLKARWSELEDEVWRDGFDWTSVISSFDKRA